MHIHIAFQTRPLAVIRARALALGHGCRYVSQQLWQSTNSAIAGLFVTQVVSETMSLCLLFFSYSLLGSLFDVSLVHRSCGLSLVSCLGIYFCFFWHWSGTYAGSALRWLAQYWERDALLSLTGFSRRSC